MALPVPDTSPRMLRIFVGARRHVRRMTHRETAAKAGREVSKIIRRDAGVSVRQFDDALAGKADAAVMARIWTALGVEVTR